MGRGRSRLQLAGVTAALAVILVVAGRPNTAHAGDDVSLQVAPIAQRFSPAEQTPSGQSDYGIEDCTAAALAMILKDLNAPLPDWAYGDYYKYVRTELRKKVPDPSAGIGYDKVRDFLPSVSTGMFQGTLTLWGKPIDENPNPEDAAAFANKWTDYLRGELQAGYPVMVAISDWSMLPGEVGQGHYAHSILVTGLVADNVIFNDPWTGKQYTIASPAFAAAWSQKQPNSSYQWIGFQIRKTGQIPVTPNKITSSSTPSPTPSPSPSPTPTPTPAPTTFNLSGTVYLDPNQNGLLDAGESPLAGQIILLDGGGTGRNIETDSSGRYLYSGVPVGRHEITMSASGTAQECGKSTSPADVTDNFTADRVLNFGIAEPPLSSPGGSKTTINGITVNDPAQFGLQLDAEGDLCIYGSDTYEIQYLPMFQSFQIFIKNADFNTVWGDATQTFLDVLGITGGEACYLGEVTVQPDGHVNPELVGQHFPLKGLCRD